MPSNAQRRAVSAVVARTTVAGQPHVVSVTQELATYPTDIIRPEHVSTPAGIARVLERLQQHSRSATQAARSLPCNGGIFFPNVSIPAGQAVVLPHGLGMDVTFLVGDVRLPSGTTQAPTIVDLGQDAAKNRLTLGASQSAIADIWVFPRPSAVGTALTTTLSSALSNVAASLAPAAANGTVTSIYAQPQVGNSVAISFNQTGWCGVGEVFTVAGVGVYKATAVGSSNITATFLGYFYDGGQPVGTNVAANSLAYPGMAMPSGTTDASWHCLYDFDFTALANQSLSGDGSKTIAGKTWTKGNSALDATAMSIVQGTGLVITPTASTDFQGANTAAPYLWISLSSLGLTKFNWSTKLRFQVSLGADNEAANFDFARAGIATIPPANNLGFVLCYLLGRGHNSVNGIGSLEIGVANSRTVSIATSLSNIGLTLSMELPFLSTLGPMIAFVGPNLAAGSAFNSGNDIPMFYQNGPGNGQLTLMSIAPLANQLGVIFGALRAGSGTSYQAKIQRFRVDYR